MFSVEFHDAFSCSIQDLSASAIAKESQVSTVEHATHQGYEVGASTFGELTRTVNDVNLLVICVVAAVKWFDFNVMSFS